VPVEASVAEIVRATSPALPMPVTTTLPVQSSSSRTARANAPSRPSAARNTASPSARRIVRPISISLPSLASTMSVQPWRIRAIRRAGAGL